MVADVMKFILGFFLAISVLAGAGTATVLYLMNKTSALPSKPVFVNDLPSLKAQVPKSALIGSTATTPIESKTQPQAKPAVKSKPTPTASPKAKTVKSLPPGAYSARVTWRQGLVMRTQPQQDGERLGGVGYNQKVFVLEESADKTWQKIRSQDGEQEGWVKAGNTRKVDEQDQTDDSN
ncbi:SH3 domain-containing protein [Iningainema tapete]|uniref:SH3 domain-containing protein n=1 Tax=Iningainema tapete BLCC-T55 TaxID=2748662 RepID=A0A8J6XKN0_9CYAN|nr:SH3 domain-containing protein [Iningainema tapete]MBD2776438.1 SH3 domain-containing protein [Iningainema tapete BLCC-T55]